MFGETLFGGFFFKLYQIKKILSAISESYLQFQLSRVSSSAIEFFHKDTSKNERTQLRFCAQPKNLFAKFVKSIYAFGRYHGHAHRNTFFLAIPK